MQCKSTSVTKCQAETEWQKTRTRRFFLNLETLESSYARESSSKRCMLQKTCLIAMEMLSTTYLWSSSRCTSKEYLVFHGIINSYRFLQKNISRVFISALGLLIRHQSCQRLQNILEGPSAQAAELSVVALVRCLNTLVSASPLVVLTRFECFRRDKSSPWGGELQKIQIK